jgi:hypothetical protein
MDAKKIAICIPSRGMNPSEFTQDLAGLVLTTAVSLPPQDNLGIICSEGTYIDKNRQELADAALLDDATHLFWLDDDMRFEPDVLLRLLAHDKPIVGLNYPRRAVASVPTAIRYIGDEHHEREPLFTNEADTGLAMVEAIGFGCLLIKAEVFEKLQRPFFETRYDPIRGQRVGEDVDFCIKARRAGFDVLVDQAASQTVGHIGKFVFGHAHANALREMAAAKRREQIASA